MPAPVTVDLSGSLGYAGDPPVTVVFAAAVSSPANATAILNPAGADNSVLFTAVTQGTAGNSITVTYAAPSSLAETTVAVSGSAITVTPGAKARMVVTGTLTSNGTTPLVFPDLLYGGMEIDRPKYVPNGLNFGLTNFEIKRDEFAGKWQILQGGVVRFESAETVNTPDLVTAWTPVGAATGAPTVTAGVSSAAQVIERVNASVSASALLTASASGTVTGAVAALSATNLSGGVTGTLPPVTVPL